jgi:hypothetical protein
MPTRRGIQQERTFLLLLLKGKKEESRSCSTSNCFALPFEIPNCQLMFDTVDVKVPPLSLTLPQKTRKYAVQFPFNISNFDKESAVKEASSNIKEEIKDGQSCELCK